MRLAILDHGHTKTQKLLFRAIRAQLGYVPGPIKTLTYRRRWFGSAYVDCLTQALRTTTAWTKAEAELFAAFVSKLNQCVY